MRIDSFPVDQRAQLLGSIIADKLRADGYELIHWSNGVIDVTFHDLMTPFSLRIEIKERSNGG